MLYHSYFKPETAMGFMGEASKPKAPYVSQLKAHCQPSGCFFSEIDRLMEGTGPASFKTRVNGYAHRVEALRGSEGLLAAVEALGCGPSALRSRVPGGHLGG